MKGCREKKKKETTLHLCKQRLGVTGCRGKKGKKNNENKGKGTMRQTYVRCRGEKKD